MMKTLYKTTTFVLLAVAAIFFSGCSKDDKNPPANMPHKLVFKAEASAGCTLNMVVYGYDATLTTASSLGGTTWTSAEITAPAGASVASFTANAIGVDASSTLKVQIYVDGVLKKEGVGSGRALAAAAQQGLQ